METEIDKLILRKLESLDSEVKKITVEAAKQATHREQFTTAWTEVTKQIENNRLRSEVNSVEIAKLNTKVNLWGITLIVGVPILMKLLIHYRII